MASKPGKRHRLLLYARLFAMLRWPALLITVLCAGLWWFAPRLPMLASDLAQAGLAIIALSCGVLFLYALVGPALSYVQCRPNHLRVSTPLFRLAISYSRIITTRPIQFLPGKLPFSQQRLVEPFIGHNAVLVDLSAYPIPEAWLRLWFNQFMFHPHARGLVLHVAEWMTVSRDIDSYRGQWKARRAERTRQPARFV